MPILFGVRHLPPGGAHHLLRLLEQVTHPGSTDAYIHLNKG